MAPGGAVRAAGRLIIYNRKRIDARPGADERGVGGRDSAGIVLIMAVQALEVVLYPLPADAAPGQPTVAAGRSSTAHALYEGCLEYGSKTASVSRLVSS